MSGHDGTRMATVDHSLGHLQEGAMQLAQQYRRDVVKLEHQVIPPIPTIPVPNLSPGPSTQQLLHSYAYDKNESAGVTYRNSISRMSDIAIAKLKAAKMSRTLLSGPGAEINAQLISITTFQSRSRETVRKLQAEAVKAKRRYIPPNREVYQSVVCTTNPPKEPEALEDISAYPVLRIGDTFECRFQPSTPFVAIGQGEAVEGHGQTALAFEYRYTNGREEYLRKLEFEIVYYSYVDNGHVCLRCQNKLDKCSCDYGNDLLEINRDWKAKRNPSRRLGLREGSNGEITVALRIPRSRRPLTFEEVQRGVPQRSNMWNSKLKLRNPKDPKPVRLQVFEFSYPIRKDGSLGERTMISHSVGYARLIAKNGSQPQLQVAKSRSRAVGKSTVLVSPRISKGNSRRRAREPIDISAATITSKSRRRTVAELEYGDAYGSTADYRSHHWSNSEVVDNKDLVTVVGHSTNLSLSQRQHLVSTRPVDTKYAASAQPLPTPFFPDVMLQNSLATENKRDFMDNVDRYINFTSAIDRDESDDDLLNDPT